VALGAGVGRQWLAERFALPYLRDVLLDRGVMTDTLETATLWSNLEALHAKVTAALAEAGAGYVMCHVSHVYPAGASLYFTFLARQEAGVEQQMEQWRRIKVAATGAIMAGGGTLSHHHGVGYEHAPWMAGEVGPVGVAAIAALKSALDPAGVMNPGKVVQEG
jgi:alkyldihydroxyacetonephosphate synthase